VADIQVAIINASTVLKDSDVQAIVPALQTQVHGDFAPAWGVDADLTFVGTGGTPASGSWWLTVLDNSDQAGALGYHDLTDEGLPMGKAFAGTDIQGGNSWTTTVSHELLEMLGDPDVDLCAYAQKDSGGMILYAYEVCDACEADASGYKIDGVLVSDFVYPAWFESFRKPGSTQFDHGKLITQPFQLLADGYISQFDTSNTDGWTQAAAQQKMGRYSMRAPVGSRRERRRTPRRHWMASAVNRAAAAGAVK
jgi:hypothetical protein